MKFKPNYIIIPWLVVLVHQLGNYVAGRGWFPVLTGEFSDPVWSVADALVVLGGVSLVVAIFILFSLLQAAPLLLFWNGFSHRERHFKSILGLFIVFGLLHIVHSYFFAHYYATYTLIPGAVLGIEILVGVMIVVGLWVHHMQLAAVWLGVYVILLGVGFHAVYVAREKSIDTVCPVRCSLSITKDSSGGEFFDQ